ncbi:MAG: hypothetical protein LBK13_07520 [Spirochaetales bacterium]|jgi:hypothetical protein|nr:hypothetical protein [Spirochaetales bacterium]
MIALEGYFEDDRFISQNSEPVPEHKRAIVTILDEDVPPGNQEDALEKVIQLIEESKDEEIPEEFPRIKFREIEF